MPASKLLSAAAGAVTVRPASSSRRHFATDAIRNPRVAKERLVILGSGWGGYTLARKVDCKKYDVTVVSPTGFFSFTPLLASTSVGTLEFRTALEPVRRIKDLKFAMARAQSIDLQAQTVTLSSSVPNPVDPVVSASNPPRAVGAAPPNYSAKDLASREAEEKFTLGFDKLVISVGCFSNTFGTPGVYEHAHFLKDVRDARAIRKRILDCFERASQPFIKESERRALLSFRIVGGGPTGVEFAGELHDLIATDMKRIYPDLASMSTINLYDAAPGILGSFDESLREYAMGTFAAEGVTVHPNSKITEVGDGYIAIEGEGKLPFGLLVWSTGLQANPLISELKDVSHEPRSKSLETDDHLRVLDHSGKPYENIFAIGDAAMIKDGPRLPATAQVASQKAVALAKNLNALVSDKPTTPFALKSQGSMVYLGGWRAMVDRTSDDVSGMKGKNAGRAAWLLWRSAYWKMSMSWRNRVLLSVYWALNWCTGRDISRF